MEVQGEDTESRRSPVSCGLASRVNRFQLPARPYSLNGDHRHTPTIGVNCLTLVYTYKNIIGRERAAARKRLTQYDAIVEAYQDSKKLPFRKAIERHTLFEALGDIQGMTALDFACGGASTPACSRGQAPSRSQGSTSPQR